MLIEKNLEKEPAKIPESKNSIYNSIMAGLKAKPSLAGRYAKKRCSQCTGKGWYEADFGQRTSIYNKICPCVEKRLHKEVEAL